MTWCWRCCPCCLCMPVLEVLAVLVVHTCHHGNPPVARHGRGAPIGLVVVDGTREGQARHLEGGAQAGGTPARGRGARGRKLCGRGPAQVWGRCRRLLRSPLAPLRPPVLVLILDSGSLSLRVLRCCRNILVPMLKLLDICWTFVGHLLDICWTFVGLLLDIVGHLLDIFVQQL